MCPSALAISFGPLSKCCIDVQHSESALRMCARESDAALMLPLSSLPSSHLLALSLTDVSLWGVTNCCAACASASLSQPVVPTVARWIWGLSGSWLRQSLHTQATTSSRHDGTAGKSLLFMTLQQFSSSYGILNVPEFPDGFAISLSFSPRELWSAHYKKHI